MTAQATKPSALIWCLLAAFIVLWLYVLGARTLVPTDEGRYAEIGREMVVTGDWITIRLNGIKYFEKPPLQSWMNAATFELFGLGDWQARLWTGLCGLLGIGIVAFTGRTLFGARVGVNAALVLGSTILWGGLGHINTLDMGLSAMMALALCGLLLAQRDGASAIEQRNGMLLCWIGMALAVMSKGLIGVVLPSGVLALYVLIARDWVVLKRLHILAGVLLFFAITTPWFLLVSLRNPEFAQFFFIHEHFDRFLSKVHHRAGPIYYFVPILLLGAIPWLGLLGHSLAQAARRQPTRFQPKLLLLIWTLFIFVFFSVSSSKLPSYILPIFPALALMIGCTLQQVSARVLRINAAILILLGVAGLALLHRVTDLSHVAFDLPLYTAYLPWIGAAAAIATSGGIAAYAMARRSPQHAIVVTAVSGFLLLQALMLGHDPLGRYAAGIDYVAAINTEMTPGTHLYSVNHYEQALPFYLRRTSTLVGQADEMDFGLKQQPELWLPEIDTFIQRWQTSEKAIAVMGPDTYTLLKNRHIPLRVIASDPRRVIVSNQLSP